MPLKKTQVSKTAKSNNPPLRQRNSAARTREYLTTQEIEKLRKAARAIGRHGHRDDTLILMLFRHALRVGEIITLRWEQVDLIQGLLHVTRLKNGLPATHPLRALDRANSSSHCGQSRGGSRISFFPASAHAAP